ncbi:MAG: cytochrome c family protein [Myxococcota bacterium]
MLWGIVSTFSLACSDPDRVILDRLNEVNRARFISGRKAANGCWVCHDLAGTVKKVGPSLLDVYGRRSGRAPEYRGSPAMMAASIVWDDVSLSAFLRDPAGFVPGNRMVSAGIGNSANLSKLLFYLKRVTRPGAREPDEN